MLFFVSLYRLLWVSRVFVRRRRIKFFIRIVFGLRFVFGIVHLLLSLNDEPIVADHLADDLLGVALGLSRNRVM